MEKEPKLMLSSLLAPLASLLIPAILASFAILEDSATQNDDAPVRAAVLLLIAFLPAAYPILAVFMAVVGYLMNRIHKLSLVNLLIINGVACIPIAFFFGRSSPFGLKDQLIGFAIFFLLAVLSLGLGTLSWWFLAIGHSKRVIRTRDGSTQL